MDRLIELCGDGRASGTAGRRCTGRASASRGAAAGTAGEHRRVGGREGRRATQDVGTSQGRRRGETKANGSLGHSSRMGTQPARGLRGCEGERLGSCSCRRSKGRTSAGPGGASRGERRATARVSHLAERVAECTEQTPAACASSFAPPSDPVRTTAAHACPHCHRARLLPGPSPPPTGQPLPGHPAGTPSPHAHAPLPRRQGLVPAIARHAQPRRPPRCRGSLSPFPRLTVSTPPTAASHARAASPGPSGTVTAGSASMRSSPRARSGLGIWRAVPAQLTYPKSPIRLESRYTLSGRPPAISSLMNDDARPASPSPPILCLGVTQRNRCPDILAPFPRYQNAALCPRLT